MYKVKLLNKISASIYARLKKGEYTCGEDVDQPDAIIVRSADMLSADIPASLKCVGRAGAGVNNIPIDKMSAAGVVVFNTPGANANAVKELAICALMLASRRVAAAIEWANTLKGKGDEVPALVEKNKNAFVGPEIMGKTLGVIGLGAVGGPLASAATHLGMEVYGDDPMMSVDAAWHLSSNVKKAPDKEFIFKNSDYISLHVPVNDQTRGMVNTETIAKMKDGVRIINFSRGELVNDDDMIKALQTGKVSCYVTDFPNDKLLGLISVVPIPHLGASTPESEENCAVMVSKQIGDYLESGVIKNSVNFPDADLGGRFTCRICVLHQNIPSVVGGVTKILESKGVGVEHMLNRSKKDNAYTMIDTSDDICGELAGEIKALDGVVAVRVLCGGA